MSNVKKDRFKINYFLSKNVCVAMTNDQYPIPNSKKLTVHWSGFSGCTDALALATAIQTHQRLFVIITPDTHSALRLENELTFF